MGIQLKNKKKSIIIISICALTLFICVSILMLNGKFERHDSITQFYKMYWFQPILKPGYYDIIALGTVISAKQTSENGIPVYQVDVRIDEKIYLSPYAKQYFLGKDIIRTSDTNLRKVGDQLVIMTDNTGYMDDEFSTPSWNGTNCDFGIALFPKGHDNFHYNQVFIQNLRKFAETGQIDENFLKIFSQFCDQCVKEYLKTN